MTLRSSGRGLVFKYHKGMDRVETLGNVVPKPNWPRRSTHRGQRSTMQIRPMPSAVFFLVALSCAQTTPPVMGRLILMPELETFQPCGSAEPLWLDGETDMLRALRAEHFELSTEPYAPTLAVLMGSVGPQLDCGFCENYEGSFHATRVVSHSAFGEPICP